MVEPNKSRGGKVSKNEAYSTSNDIAYKLVYGTERNVSDKIFPSEDQVIFYSKHHRKLKASKTV